MATDRWMTAEELLWLPDDGMRHELIEGVLQTMPLHVVDHAIVTSNLGFDLSMFVRSQHLGRVWSNTGFILSRDPDTVLGPNVAFVRANSVPPFGEQNGYFPGAPDLAAEVIAATDVGESMDRKRERYLAAGTRLVWIADLDGRTVRVYTPDRKRRTLRTGETLDGGGVLPGFAITVNELFA